MRTLEETDDNTGEWIVLSTGVPDVKARLQAIRSLAAELEGDRIAERPNAMWSVVRVPPKERAA